MPRATWKIVVCLAVPCAACACAGMPAPTSVGSSPGSFPGGVAKRSAAAGMETFDVAYRGMGGAVEAPLRDFNFAHAHIPAPLRQARAKPYDLEGLDSCEALTAQIAALDLVLGPDLDTPDVERVSDVYSRGAGLVADAALEALRSAAQGYVPMRSVIRRLSGAEKLERRTRKAELAGAVRRGFLKAIGLERGCGWPAAPLGAQLRIPLPPEIKARFERRPDEPPTPPPPASPLVIAAQSAQVIRVSAPVSASQSPKEGGGATVIAALPSAAHTLVGATGPR